MTRPTHPEDTNQSQQYTSSDAKCLYRCTCLLVKRTCWLPPPVATARAPTPTRHVLELAARRHSEYSEQQQEWGRFSLVQLPVASDCASLATTHPMVTILFADIVGFTK